MWKKVFGRGLVEPADDWRDDTVASIPELMDHLESLMVRVNFDLKNSNVFCSGPKLSKMKRRLIYQI